MNTALGAYARLRRNHVAYEAATFQWSGCDVPDGYVEPAPAALAGMMAYAQLGQSRAKLLDPSGAIGVSKYYRRLERIFSVLSQIVAHELVGAPLTRAELDFIHQIAEVHDPTYEADVQFDGWYMGLFFEHREYKAAPARSAGDPIGMRLAEFRDVNVPDAMAEPSIAVDIATAIVGGHGVVSHLGTSPTHWAVFVVDVGGAPRALVGPVSLAYSAARAHPERLTDEAARGLSVDERHAPWTKTFAPWYTRERGRWPAAMIDIECVRDAADECHDVALRFASKELVGRLDMALHGRDGERIARRISYVRAGKHEVTFGLPRGDGPLDERIGHISIRRGDDEQIIDTYDEVFGTAEYPLEVALGQLAHEGDDWVEDDDGEASDDGDGGALDTGAVIVKGLGK